MADSETNQKLRNENPIIFQEELEEEQEISDSRQTELKCTESPRRISP
jgi:hypothetical protein